MKVIEVVDAYLTRQRSLGMRFESAGQILHRFSREMGNLKIDEVSPESVADFVRGKGVLSASFHLKLRIPTFPAGHSDSDPATHSDPFPATCSELISAKRMGRSQQVWGSIS